MGWRAWKLGGSPSGAANGINQTMGFDALKRYFAGAGGAAFPGVTRPLRPYPKVARYKGGDTRSADSFACAP